MNDGVQPSHPGTLGFEKRRAIRGAGSLGAPLLQLSSRSAESAWFLAESKEWVLGVRNCFKWAESGSRAGSGYGGRFFLPDSTRPRVLALGTDKLKMPAAQVLPGLYTPRISLLPEVATKASMSVHAEIESIFLRWGPMVLRRARAILGNEADAEEAMQDVFLKLYDTLDNFEGRSNVSTWLYRVATNLCLNRLRDENRRRELRAIHLQENISFNGPAGQVIARETLLKVPDVEWARAAVYVYADGMTQDEAAKLMGVSVRTIGNYLRRLKDWASKEQQSSISERGGVGS